RRLAVLAAECHHRVQDQAAAWRAITEALAWGEDPDLFLAAANLEPDPERRVGWLNRALRHYGLAEVSLATPLTGPALDHLRAAPAAVPLPAEPGAALPTVTVIVPAYHAAATIRTALDSVLAQTWPRLEVLVVDDASTDATARVVAEYAAADPRVRLIRAEVNGGTYVARNLALREATGEFVTCHDTDDWSHPAKIERQARHLLAHPEAVANTSEQVRTAPDLTFHR